MAFDISALEGSAGNTVVTRGQNRQDMGGRAPIVVKSKGAKQDLFPILVPVVFPEDV